MNTRIRLLSAALLALGAGLALPAGSALGATPSAADGAGLPPGVVLEGSVETTTDAVMFPADGTGRLQVRSCAGCAHATVQLDANTLFLIGGDKVSLRDMAQYALRTPGHALTVHYRLKDTVATRVTVLVR